MGTDRLKVHSNERVDLDDFEFLAGEWVQANLRQFNHRFAMEDAVVTSHDKTGYILSGFAMTNPSAKQLQVTKGKALLSQRLNGSVVQGILTTEGDAVKIIDLNTYTPGVYGIFIRFEEVAGSSQSRIFWSPTGDGSEYTDSVVTRYTANWAVRIEPSSPGAEWLQIGSVDQATMAITDKRPFYYEGLTDSSYASGWSSDGGGGANDRNANRALYGIDNLHMFVRAMKQCVEDLKGRGLRRWWSREIGGMNIGFDADPSEGTIALGDANFYLKLLTGDPIVFFDSAAGNDYLQYDRSENCLRLYIGGSVAHSWTVDDYTTTARASVGEISILPDNTNLAEQVAMRTTGLWTKPCGLTHHTMNTISGGGTKAYVDMKVIYTADLQPRLLVLDAASNTIEVWDPHSLTLLDTSHDLSTDLLVPLTFLWKAVNMATDGTYVFVMFTETAASPAHHCVHAWRISDWAIKPVWAGANPTGVQLPGTGNGLEKDGYVIIASDTKLVTANCWNVITASNSPALSVLSRSSGSIVVSGAGDAPTGVSGRVLTLCSDGVCIFFNIHGTTQYKCSAIIESGLNSGCGGTGYPLAYTSGAAGYSRMVNCAPDLNVAILLGQAAPTLDALHVFNSADASLDVLHVGRDPQATPLDGVEYATPYYNGAIYFDGVNIWIYGLFTYGTVTWHCALIKLDVSKLLMQWPGRSKSFPELVSGVFYVPQSEQLDLNAALRFGKYASMVSDGRDVWVIPEPLAGQARSGKIYRLFNAAFRS